MPLSSAAVPVLLQFVVVTVLLTSLCVIITNPTAANAHPSAGKLRLRDTYSDSTRFFLPDALLADQLLSSAGPVHSFRPAAIDRSLSPAKRYFDSLAGQSLGKRSAAPRGSIEDEDEMPTESDRRRSLNALRPGWQMW